MYEERTYRERVRPEGLVRSDLSFQESDLCIFADREVASRALVLLGEARFQLEAYIERDEGFKTALSPHDPIHCAPLIVRKMADAARRFGVGPMAAVAGAVAEHVGDRIAGNVMIENGGDIYARTKRPITLSLYAGESSPFTGKVKFRVDSRGESIGIATSSATHGHSLSFGKADAVCVVSASAVDADAAATAFCNKVQREDDIDAVIEEAMGHEGVKGIIVAIGDKLGVKGDIEFI